MHGEAPFDREGAPIAEYACKHCDVLGDMVAGIVVVKTGLHVFRMGHTDYVVAHNAEDAWAVLSQHGYERCDYDDDDLEECPDSDSINILCDAEGHISDGGEALRLTHGEWADREGRGFLCSTEF